MGVSVEINKNFSKMKTITFDDNKINNWLNNVLSYSGEYYSLTIHHNIMDCSDDSYGALNAYKFKAAEFHQLRLTFEEVCGEDLNWFFNQCFNF